MLELNLALAMESQMPVFFYGKRGTEMKFSVKFVSDKPCESYTFRYDCFVLPNLVKVAGIWDKVKCRPILTLKNDDFPARGHNGTYTGTYTMVPPPIGSGCHFIDNGKGKTPQKTIKTVFLLNPTWAMVNIGLHLRFKGALLKCTAFLVRTATKTDNSLKRWALF